MNTFLVYSLLKVMDIIILRHFNVFIYCDTKTIREILNYNHAVCLAQFVAPCLARAFNEVLSGSR